MASPSLPDARGNHTDLAQARNSRKTFCSGGTRKRTTQIRTKERHAVRGACLANRGHDAPVAVGTGGPEYETSSWYAKSRHNSRKTNAWLTSAVCDTLLAAED